MTEPAIIVALRTYGTQVQSGLTCIKCVNGVPSILMKLFGARAKNMSSPRTSYSYIHVDGARLKQGFLILKVTASEQIQIEETVRHYDNLPCAFLWKDGEWYEFPCKQHPDYRSARALNLRSYPRFRGDAARYLCPSDPTDTSLGSHALPPDSDVHIQRSQRYTNGPVWWWISGATKPHQATLESAGARWSHKRQQYYYVGQALPEAILDLQKSAAKHVPSVPAASTAPTSSPNEDLVLGEALVMAGFKSPASVGPQAGEGAASEADPSSPAGEQPKETGVRIVKSLGLPTEGIEPGAIEQAVARLNDPFATDASVPINTKGLAAIGQRYVGELTGDITGNVHCFGYAIHEGVLIYLNLGGPHTAVEAIRAKLSKGESVNLIPWDGPAVELTAGEGKTGMYADFMQKIPEARFTSLILAHRSFTEPNYGGKSTTFILRASMEQAVGRLKHHVTELVKVPVFDEWGNYLWHAGEAAGSVQRTRSDGDIDLWTVKLDIDLWTRLITGGLAQGYIELPLAVR